VVAAATAATAAVTLGGPAVISQAAESRPAARISASTTIATSVGELDAIALLRDEQRAQRSTQRAQLAAAAAAAEVARDQAARDAATAAAMAAERAARFAPAPLVLPVSGYRLTSMYGPRWGSFHTGIDMAVPYGTAIKAIGGGEVVSAAYDGSFGRKIVIRMADGTEIWYCHQSRFAVGLGPVEAGQVIGYVGMTGHTTGPHVHIEVHPGGGDAVDPRRWLADHGLDV
jgi:murein DD-endopeptidase MepM/ murein hydrolase activator NlpD